MGQLYNNTETHYDQEIEFTYEGEQYLWHGDYSIKTWGETSDFDYCGDSEQEVEIDDTVSIRKFNEDQNDWLDVKPTPSMIYEVCFEIERNL
jgi:hypothetical protein